LVVVTGILVVAAMSRVIALVIAVVLVARLIFDILDAVAPDVLR
jgi:hypothetical protein